MRRYLRLAVFVATLAMTLTTGTAALAAAVRAPTTTAVSVPATAAAAVDSVGDQVAAARVAMSRVAPSAGSSDRASRVSGHDPKALPTRSGHGRRVVFQMSAQRVWLVRKGGDVARSYEVSASRSDNLAPGTYQVYSRSRHATSYDLKSTMDHFVRFAHGDNAAIGFHDIPVDRAGKPLQTRSELGTPLSSGCIRQARDDAVALWRFAPVGTKVVVVR